MAIVLKIDNVDKSDLINFDSLEVQNNLYSKADACYFTYEKFGNRVYVPAGGDEIGVWDGAIKIFGGKITNVKVKIEGKVLIYDIECKDWVDQLDGELVAETYENQTVNAIVADLKSKYATTFDITNVSCATVIEAIYFDMKPMSKCLDELAEIAGYHWYVDPDKKIYLFAEGSITSPFDITDTNGKCLTQSLEIEEDYEQIKNRVNILGGSIANVQVYDAVSIAAYGEHEVVIRDDTLTSTDEATQKANAVLAAFKDPIKNGSFGTYDAGLVAGQKININSTLRGVNQDFIIQSVGFKARTPTDFNYDVQVMTQQGQGIIDLFEQEIMKPPPVAEESFGNKDFVCDVKFTIVNYHKIEWEAGSIIMSSGETYNIAAGDHEFTNTEICFFCPGTSTTVLQFSTTFGDGTGDDRVPLGYAIPNPNVALGAQFIPKGFMGGVRFWGGENIVARTIIAQQIGLEALTSDLVTTGEFITLSAQIKDAIITNAKVVSLDAAKITTGTLVVARTEAKCTDPNADETAANAQPYTWISGAKPPVDADKTSDNPQPSTWLSTAVEAAKLGTTVIQGGYIISSLLTATNIVTGTLNASVVNVTNLNADNITTGTLTGRIVRTAASGTRVEMQTGGTYANNLLLYYGSNIIGWLWQSGNTFVIENPQNDNILFKVGGAQCVRFYPAYALMSDIRSTEHRPTAADSYDLGTTSYRWRNIYLKDGGRLYGGATYGIKFEAEYAAGYTCLSMYDVGGIYPRINNWAELGLSTLKFYKIWRNNESACEMPTSNSALAVFKKIKAPKIAEGEYGERHYFKDADFPQEMRHDDKRSNTNEIELTRTLGVTVQAVRELADKVEALEEKVG